MNQDAQYQASRYHWKSGYYKVQRLKMTDFWNTALRLAVWISALAILFIGCLDITEWGLRQYTLNQYPLNGLPVSSEPTELYYGGRVPHILLKSIDFLRRQSYIITQSVIPIPSAPPLYSLLPNYDFVIVGGGTAASVVASRSDNLTQYYYCVTLLSCSGYGFSSSSIHLTKHF